ncbi:MAG: hypothetical protein GFH25_541182n10 [Chloroflexi bacterium AL-N10]|nr:hypothetical protein [Chloroflexi bacterium AL-N10]
MVGLGVRWLRVNQALEALWKHGASAAGSLLRVLRVQRSAGVLVRQQGLRKEAGNWRLAAGTAIDVWKWSGSMWLTTHNVRNAHCSVNTLLKGLHK